MSLFKDLIYLLYQLFFLKSKLTTVLKKMLIKRKMPLWKSFIYGLLSSCGGFNLSCEAEIITNLLSGFSFLIFWLDFRLLLASCIPHRNWLLRVQETHSYKKTLILKQHWTIFSILQCHIQMHKLTAHVWAFLFSRRNACETQVLATKVLFSSGSHVLIYIAVICNSM